MRPALAAALVLAAAASSDSTSYSVVVDEDDVVGVYTASTDRLPRLSGRGDRSDVGRPQTSPSRTRRKHMATARHRKRRMRISQFDKQQLCSVYTWLGIIPRPPQLNQQRSKERTIQCGSVDSPIRRQRKSRAFDCLDTTEADVTRLMSNSLRTRGKSGTTQDQFSISSPVPSFVSDDDSEIQKWTTCVDFDHVGLGNTSPSYLGPCPFPQHRPATRKHTNTGNVRLLPQRLQGIGTE